MKMYVYSFENLNVWKLAKEMVKLVYRKTTGFPTEEKYGLTSQMRRAAISVASNLAEGSSRNTPKDQAHFTNMSYSSLMELLNQAIIAFELEYLEEDAYWELRKKVQNLSYRLNNLRDSQSDEG